MELKLDLSAVKKLQNSLDGIRAKDMPFLCAYALTKTMQGLQQGERALMGSVFDRPTSYALNSLAVIPATKTNLTAELYVRQFGGTPAWKFLGPEIDGGPRRKKGFERALERAGILRSSEYAVPTKNAPLDGNGNVPGSVITRILSDVMANPDPMSNTRAAGRKRRLKSGKGTYFAIRDRGRLPNGIYFRLGLRDIRAIFVFVRQPSYSPRYPYYLTADKLIPKAFAENFTEGWRRYVLPKLGAR